MSITTVTVDIVVARYRLCQLVVIMIFVCMLRLSSVQGNPLTGDALGVQSIVYYILIRQNFNHDQKLIINKCCRKYKWIRFIHLETWTQFPKP